MDVYLTQDLGKTWKLLQKYVAQFEWAPSADGVLKPGMEKTSIFMVTYAMTSGNQPFGVWSAKAQFSLGIRFAEGRGVARDPGRALHWFEKVFDGVLFRASMASTWCRRVYP